MRVGVMIEGQEGLTWERWLRLTEAAEDMGYESLCRSDHLTSLAGESKRPSLETWTSLTLVAARTRRIRFGPMVSPITFYQPALLAKMAVALDTLSRGRLDLGLGAGWNEPEHATFGIPLPPVKERLDRLEAAARYIRALGVGEPVTLDQSHYALRKAENYPLPTYGRLRLVIGGRGEKRTLRIAAEFADEWNVTRVDPDGFRQKREVLAQHCATVRRDPETIARSLMIPLAIADSLLLNYGSNPRFTEFVDQREIWIVPTVNPDGFVYVENVNTNWRKNRRNNGGSFGVDLNRNYDYQWGHDDNGSSSFPSSDIYRGPSPASEPEIQAVQNFVNSRSFVFSISYHSYGNWWLWGPGYKPGLGVDQDVFAGYGEHVASLNGYEPGNPASGTIYITNGSADDWLHNSPAHAKIYGMTPEVGGPSDGFYPPESRIGPLILENMETAWLALEHADREAGVPATLADVRAADLWARSFTAETLSTLRSS